MRNPPLHPQEEQRQKSLDDLDIVDTPADPYLDSLVRLARDVFKVDRVLISLVDRDRQWFKARAGAGIEDSTPRNISFCAHAILQEASTMVIPDTHNDERFTDNPLVTQAPYIRFYAGHSLIASSGLPVGTLCLLHSQPRELSASERDRLRDIAQIVEGYIKLRSLTEHTQKLREAVSRERRRALIDPLTQLWNRAALEHFYPGEQAQATRNHEQIGILFADLDRFKQINDRYGHAVGDQVLVESAHRIATSLRPYDLLMRFGGEEFVIIARVEDQDQLMRIAERIRVAVTETPIVTTTGQVAVTTSVGGTYGSPNDDVDLLLARADAALYEAKGKGRNVSVMR
jgi:diguanylate cyclase (GGDEF)-like protein